MKKFREHGDLLLEVLLRLPNEITVAFNIESPPYIEVVRSYWDDPVMDSSMIPQSETSPLLKFDSGKIKYRENTTVADVPARGIILW